MSNIKEPIRYCGKEVYVYTCTGMHKHVLKKLTLNEMTGNFGSVNCMTSKFLVSR